MKIQKSPTLKDQERWVQTKKLIRTPGELYFLVLVEFIGRRRGLAESSPFSVVGVPDANFELELSQRGILLVVREISGP